MHTLKSGFMILFHWCAVRQQKDFVLFFTFSRLSNYTCKVCIEFKKVNLKAKAEKFKFCLGHMYAIWMS